MPKLAIIGTGIAGLGCAHFLHRAFDITLFEQSEHIGGHSRTIEVVEPGTGRVLPIDTGFMVYNEVTYPELTRLFAQLRVAVKPIRASYSVAHTDIGLEYCGGSLNHLFAQRKNLFSVRFWKMLRSIHRFNSEAAAALDEPETQQLTLGEYVRSRGYGEDFFHLYLLPMSSAVWSTPPELMLSFPAATLLRFFHNHGFLGLHSPHPWLTLEGGARSYVEKLTAPWRHRIRLRQKAIRILRSDTVSGATVNTAQGESLHFDKVILACHADQALRLLVNPTPDEARLLGEFQYLPSIATLHTDASVMPRTPRVWSSWNLQIAVENDERIATSTHYWMNRLQGVSNRENYFVSLNQSASINPAKVLQTIPFEHPLFNLGAVRAQSELPALNTLSADQSTYFCGSYFRYGFHEDAFASAVKVCEAILARNPWTNPS